MFSESGGSKVKQQAWQVYPIYQPGLLPEQTQRIFDVVAAAGLKGDVILREHAGVEYYAVMVKRGSGEALAQLINDNSPQPIAMRANAIGFDALMLKKKEFSSRLESFNTCWQERGLAAKIAAFFEAGRGPAAI